MTVHKKHEPTKEEKKVESTPETAKAENIVVSDVVTETIEVVETAPAGQTPAQDPLSEFKEKMVEEERFESDQSQGKNYMWPILLIFIIAIVILTGIFVYKQGIFTGEKVNVVALNPTPIPTTAPEPSETIDLSKYEIQVLNGSGVTGEAGRQRESLETEGFTVSSVGNADNSDYTDTVIQAKAEVDKNFLNKLKNVLEESFTVGDSEVLSDTASVPVVVIIGTKK